MKGPKFGYACKKCDNTITAKTAKANYGLCNFCAEREVNIFNERQNTNFKARVFE